MFALKKKGGKCFPKTKVIINTVSAMKAGDVKLSVVLKTRTQARYWNLRKASECLISLEFFKIVLEPLLCKSYVWSITMNKNYLKIFLRETT